MDPFILLPFFIWKVKNWERIKWLVADYCRARTLTELRQEGHTYMFTHKTRNHSQNSISWVGMSPWDPQAQQNHTCSETDYLRKDLLNEIPPINALDKWAVNLLLVLGLLQISESHISALCKREKKKKDCKRTSIGSCCLQYSHKCHSSRGLLFTWYIFMYFREIKVKLFPQEGNMKSESDYQEESLFKIV